MLMIRWPLKISYRVHFTISWCVKRYSCMSALRCCNQANFHMTNVGIIAYMSELGINSYDALSDCKICLCICSHRDKLLEIIMHQSAHSRNYWRWSIRIVIIFSFRKLSVGEETQRSWGMLFHLGELNCHCFSFKLTRCYIMFWFLSNKVFEMTGKSSKR
jgi:hypothetical protein